MRLVTGQRRHIPGNSDSRTPRLCIAFGFSLYKFQFYIFFHPLVFSPLSAFDHTMFEIDNFEDRHYQVWPSWYVKLKGKCKAIPVQPCTVPECCRRLRLPVSRHMKTVSLSALRTGRLYPPMKYSWYLFSSDSGVIMRSKENRSRDLQACSALPDQRGLI